MKAVVGQAVARIKAGEFREVINLSKCARERNIMPPGVEIASVESIGDLWQRSCSTVCSQVNNARQGVRSIENAIRPAQELNLVDSRS